MLRVHVGMSRNLSRDYNSTGFSINVEGEVCVSLDEPDRVIGKIQELYDLAEESLRDQVDRHEGDSAIASRDETTRPTPRRQHNENGSNGRSSNRSDAASTKQTNYLLEIGRRRRFTPNQLESEAAEILGRSVGLYDMTKRDAGAVIDALKNGSKA